MFRVRNIPVRCTRQGGARQKSPEGVPSGGEDARGIGWRGSAVRVVASSRIGAIAGCGEEPTSLCHAGPSGPAVGAPAPSAATASPLDKAATLTFRRNGTEVRKLTLGAMLDGLKTETITAYDPY